MNEFIEKLIGRLEEEHEKCINRYGVVGGNLPAMEVRLCMEIVNELAEEYKNKSNIIYDLKAFLKEKFKYNSEQAEIWRDGSDNDAYFRQQKDSYMDSANIYGEVMREIDRLAEEHNGGWIPCSERLPKDGQYVLVWDSLNNRTTIAYYDCPHWIEIDYSKLDVSAWQPLPEPYKPKGEYG